MAEVYLYNLSNTEKFSRVKFALLKQGLRFREIPPEEYAHPLGYLAGMEGFSPAEEDAVPFSEEMLVMNGLSSRQLNELLNALRRARAPIALKAVLTEHNVHWSSEKLCRELRAEHEAMTAKAKSVHRTPETE